MIFCFLKCKTFNIIMGIGDWGWGIGDWGLGPIPNPQSPIPNPQSPIPNYIKRFYILEKKNHYKNFYYKKIYLNN